MWFLIVLGVCFLIVRWFIGGMSRAQAVDDAKEATWERTARQVFIEEPVERTKWSNLFMDKISQSMVIHDRARFRESAGELALKQIRAYETFARSEEDDWLIDFADGDKRKDMALKWPGVETLLRDHFERPDVLDRLAAETGENFEDGAGMRRALAACAVAALRAEFDESAKLDAEEGYSSVATSPGPFGMYPCPQCQLVWRELAKRACRGCGYEFPCPMRNGPEQNSAE